MTGGLDEVQIRDIEERAHTSRELEERRAAVLERSKAGQARRRAANAPSSPQTTKQALEDLYLPFKPKRRTRATIARERGLEPLAERSGAGA